jgi:hypothetical protein
MRELESSLQEFGEFLLKAQLVRPTAAPYFVRWVRRFLGDGGVTGRDVGDAAPDGGAHLWRRLVDVEIEHPVLPHTRGEGERHQQAAGE